MTLVQVNGIGFEAATNWTADKLEIALGQQEGGPTTGVIAAYDPNGPNSGSTTAGVAVSTWSDSVIEISFDAESFDPYVQGAQVLDVTQQFSSSYDLAPDQPTSAPQLPSISLVQEDFGDIYRGSFEVSGSNLSGLGTVRVYYDSGLSYVDFDNPPGGPTVLALRSDILAGETLTGIDLYSAYPATPETYVGGTSLLLSLSDFPYRFSYNSGTDELTVTQVVGFDFNIIDNIRSYSNGQVSLFLPDWQVVSSSEIVIDNAFAKFNGGPIETMLFKSNDANIDQWDAVPPRNGTPSPVTLS